MSLFTHRGQFQQTHPTMINATIPQRSAQILTFVAVLQNIMQQRHQQFSINSYHTAFLVHDAHDAPFGLLLRSLQIDAGMPVMVSDFAGVPRRFITRQEHDENHLYVFLFTHASQFYRINSISASMSLATTAPKIVLLLDADGPFEAVVERADAVFRHLNRYVMFRSDGEVLVHLPAHVERFSVGASLANATASRSLFVRIRFVVHAEQMARNLTIFMHYRAYHCMIVPIGDTANNLELIGSDVMMAHAVARQMHRQAALCTDAKLVDPEFAQGKYEQVSAYTAETAAHLKYGRMRNFVPAYVFDFNT